jgi:hypothetical protein
MKKVFNFTHEKKKPERLVEACKHEIKKYMKRERAKALPENATFWDFDCKFGASKDSSEVMTHLELNKALDGAIEAGLTECYVEVVAKATTKAKSE